MRMQHIDLQKERNLANYAGWFFGTAAWGMTVIALLTQSGRWGWTAGATWVMALIIGKYESDLDAQMQRDDPAESCLQDIDKIQQEWWDGSIPMNVALSEIRSRVGEFQKQGTA